MALEVKGSKLQGALSVPFLSRVVIPGVVAVLVFYPRLLSSFDLSAEDVKWQDLLVAAVTVLVVGGAVSTLSETLYKIYEGRRFWPNFLLSRGRKLQQSRVEKLLAKADAAQKTDETAEYDELWVMLRLYPLNEEGDPFAPYPTALGNLLSAYEGYPKSRYGLDSVFYWPRLWLSLDGETRQAVDEPWSVADGLLSVSGILVVGGLLWTSVGTVLFGLWLALEASGDAASAVRSLTEVMTTGFAGPLLLVLGWVVYRVSLPYHEQNGEVFKSLYDLHRDKLAPMRDLRPSETRAWNGTWSYLQYLRVLCQCGEYYNANESKCPHCTMQTAKNLEALSIEKRRTKKKAP